MQNATFIASKTFFQGQMTCHHNLHIQSQVEGHIQCDQIVFIEQNGYFKGEINAKEIVIKGMCEGTTTCDTLRILNGGHFNGTIKSHLLAIDQNGHFEGSRSIIEKQYDTPKKERKPIAPFETENILL